ncbi:unnamed protein product, partial [Medioppia subpectinata]
MASNLEANKYRYSQKEYRRLLREEKERHIAEEYLRKRGIHNVEQLFPPAPQPT